MFYFFYYFPLGIDLRPLRRPWATWVVIAACFGGFILQRSHPTFFWVNYGALVFVPNEPSPSSLVLNAYMHGGWMHLISNMITLAVFGPALEGRIGAKRFLFLYHLCNVFANLVQGALILLALPAYANAGVVGASGAIAGVLGLCAVRLHFARLRLGYWAFLPLQAFTRGGIANISILVAIILWFVLQAGLALMQLHGAGAGVAVGSHLGGLLAGAALALMAGYPHAASLEALWQRGQRYLDRAQWYAAQSEFIEYVRRRPQDPNGQLELARTYSLTGNVALADDHYRAACHVLASQGQLDRVEAVYIEAERGSPLFTLAPVRQLQLAQAQERCMRTAAAEKTYLRYADHHAGTAAAPRALYRAARLAAKRAGNEAHAQSLFQRLVDDYPSTPEAGLARCERPLLSAA